MKKLTISILSAFCAAAFAGCGPAANTTNVSNAKVMNGSMNNTSNVAVVVNNDSPAVANSNKGVMNANVSRADYDKDRAKYEAEKGGSTIGQGANDSWIWFKTKAALAASDDLRDSTINVDVDNDVITLKGSVATAAQKTQAETVAKGIEGQKGVKNELKVQPKDSMTNQMVNGSGGNKMTNANANAKTK